MHLFVALAGQRLHFVAFASILNSLPGHPSFPRSLSPRKRGVGIQNAPLLDAREPALAKAVGGHDKLFKGMRS
jgi:hypothetical protein